MTGWRFSDRAWFHNESLNLLAEPNRQRIAAELVERNIVFGSHRWFAGGRAPTLLAITTIEEWDDEVARGRAGDNIILLSLREVAPMAVLHAGNASTLQVAALGSHDQALIEAFNRTSKHGELLCVRRFTSRAGRVEASVARLDLRDASEPWGEQLAVAASAGGELWLFDGDLGWRDHERRQQGPEPPESWTAHHGLCLVDGYLPDAQGRVVCGGPY